MDNNQMIEIKKYKLKRKSRKKRKGIRSLTNLYIKEEK